MDAAEATRDAIEHCVQLCMKQMSGAGTRPMLVAADVSDAEQVAQMYTEAKAEYGGLNILINNARADAPIIRQSLRMTDQSVAPGPPMRSTAGVNSL
ncbi:MAG: SDR family NAD(P)-dependent oxidoreductase [Actinomycetota bacterium]|nr:SDR family NAD(P)-dependent oxidoreductase [Actinomycetota bacterium]MDQ3904046.1 SDR family NAD(P)-dependent oxidoreductase [Actinomycetota bacterium]